MTKQIIAGVLGFLTLPGVIVSLVGLGYGLGWIGTTISDLHLPPHPYWVGFATQIGLTILGVSLASFFVD